MVAWRDQIDNDIRHAAIVLQYANGSTDLEAHLSPIFAPGDPARQVGKLTPAAARSWQAMVARALADGIPIEPTSSVDAFRPLAVQERIFAQRYTTTDQGAGSRICGGRRWYKRPGVATAACPGTSNHGRGEAVDVANCSGARLAWLEAHARAYGWAWELSSEPWHIHYLLGDALPAGVADTFDQEVDDMPKNYELEADCTVEGRAFRKGQFVTLLGNVRREATVDEIPELVRQWGKAEPINVVAFANLVASTSLDMAGMRSLPSPQRDQLAVAAAGQDPEAFAAALAERLDGVTEAEVADAVKAVVKDAVKQAIREGTGG